MIPAPDCTIYMVNSVEPERLKILSRVMLRLYRCLSAPLRMTMMHENENHPESLPFPGCLSGRPDWRFTVQPRPNPWEPVIPTNRLIRTGTTPLGLWHPGDVICLEAQYSQALQMVREGGFDFVICFSGEFREFTAEGVQRFDSGEPNLENCEHRVVMLSGSSAGPVMFKAESMRRCGGFNEKILGWGPNDTEFYYRVQALGFKIGRCDGPIFHFPHGRPPESSRESPYFAAGNAEWARVKALPIEDLKREFLLPESQP